MTERDKNDCQGATIFLFIDMMSMRSVQFFINLLISKTGLVVPIVTPGNTKGGSITVPLTSCLTGFD
jgi:hypothetical protein